MQILTLKTQLEFQYFFFTNRTALHCAAELGHRDSVEELLDKEADPNIRDINGVFLFLLIGLRLD